MILIILNNSKTFSPVLSSH